MSTKEKGNEASRPSRFSLLVNSETYRTDDRYIDGEDALQISDHDPADQHILIELNDRGTTSVGLDEKIDLGDGAKAFRAFQGDRIFRLTVEGRGYEWGQRSFAESELRRIHRIAADEVFSMSLPGEDLIIDDDGEVDLEAAGAERLDVVKRPEARITVNTKPVKISRGWHDGIAIKTAAIAQGVAIQLDFILDLEGEGVPARVIGDIDRVFIRGGEKFGAVDNHEDS